MKGSRILGYVCTTIAALAFYGFLTGATHHIATFILAATVAAILFSKKTFKA